MKKSINTNLKAFSLILIIALSYSFSEKENTKPLPDIKTLEFKLNSKSYEIAPFDAGKMTFEKAIKIGNGLTINDKSGWRLPTTKELDMIYKTAYRKKTKLNGKIVYHPNHHFKGSTGFYWTSDEVKGNSTEVYVKSFYDGKKTSLSVNSEAHVRYIRIKEH